MLRRLLRIRSTRLAEPPVIALVGGSTLLGRELRDVLAYAQPDARVKLVAAEGEEAGTLTEQAGEPAVITDLDEENRRSARAVLLALLSVAEGLTGPPAISPGKRRVAAG